MAASKKQSAYAKAGVDIVKADHFVSSIASMVRSTHNANVVKVPNGYAGLYRLSGDQFLAATTDGVGTKLKLAFELRTHDTVGTDLVAMSVNDLICVGAKPLFFLDYFATGVLDIKVSKAVIRGIARACQESGVALIGGETAEMPGFYARNEYDLGGFAVGLVSKSELLDGKRIRSGDLILGLESSGLHSNGFSLVRKILSSLKSEDQKIKLKKICLTPTRLYVNAARTLQKLGPHLKGLAHITGSGFLNVPRLHEGFDYFFDYQSQDMPPLFQLLQERGGLSWEEMFTTFNMGIGLMAVVTPSEILKTQRLLARAGYPSRIVGMVGTSIRGKKRAPRVRIAGDRFRVELKY